MDIDEFWSLVEGSAREADGPDERLRWLEDRLSRLPLSDVVHFQVHLDAARGPANTYVMWGAARLIMWGACSDDGFWYFQPWLIGQGRHWYSHAVANPDNLADVPAVRALAERERGDWGKADWPQWELLDYVARRVYARRTGQEEGLYDALDERGEQSYASPHPSDRAWDIDDPEEQRRRLPRLAQMFP
jgi:hypothetical protein